MDKHYFISLLRKYLDGEASKAELQFILSYYNLFQAEPEVLALLESEEKNRLKRSIKQGIWEKIESSEKVAQRKPRTAIVNMSLITVAAAAMIIFVFRLVWQDSTPVKMKPVSNLSFIRNGNHIISLPDGSTVTLSSGSKLNYPASFSAAGNRDVYLEGQAFFDIQHDSFKPFIVHAGKVAVTVLGTAFNVKALPGEGDITVTVKRGKVRVSDPVKTLGTITPLQQIVYNKLNQHAVQRSVATEAYLDWRKLDCLFDNLTITEVAALLEERYKVEIVVDGQLAKSERFTATFPQNESLEQALNSICEFNNAVYRFDKEKNKVLISKK